MDIRILPDWLAYGAMRAINQLGDALFYDVHSLSNDERLSISHWFIPEGGLFVIEPTKTATTTISPPFSAGELISNPRLARGATTLVVAGVGSSPLGTAALARNTADALEEPVLGLVSGYGMANLLSEGMGGYFAFHIHNEINASVDRLAEFSEIVLGAIPGVQAYEAALKPSWRSAIGRKADSQALRRMLLEKGIPIDRIVGHSKGNYMIADALRGFVQNCTDDAFLRTRGRMRIISLGAVVEIPAEFGNVTQYLGGFDLLGMLNSTRSVPKETLPGKAHSLNDLFTIMLPINAEGLLRKAIPLPGGSGTARLSRPEREAAEATARATVSE